MSNCDECPTCDTCGTPITTGLMAVLCPRREQCEFWPEDASEGAKQFIRDMWRDADQP